MNETANKEVTPSLLRYIYPDDWDYKKKEENPIDAEEIVEAIKNGKEVEIINAVIEGPFILKSVNVESKVSIQQTKIRGPLDCSYSTFKKVLSFENSIFETDATFISVLVNKDIVLNNVTFSGVANFSDINVTGIFYSRSATYKKQTIFVMGDFKNRIELDKSKFEGEVNFRSARIGNNAEFIGANFKKGVIFNSSNIEGSAFFKSAIFEGEANFGSTQIGRNAEFDEVNFKEKLIFNNSHIKKSASFKSAIFEDEINFGSTQIGRNADFLKSYFKGLVIFNSSNIVGSAFFKSTTFEDEVNFVRARIGINAEFTEAYFKGKAIFNAIQIGGSAAFFPATFEGEANFGSTRIGSDANFAGAKFKGEAKFGNTRIGGNAMFIGADFKEKVTFNSTLIQRESHFEKTIFANDVIFENTSFETIYFGEPETQFNAKIDLRGCIYNRIFPVSFWEQLTKHLDPYDRQPFTQLEVTFRRAGMDKLADDVYYEQRRLESAQKTLCTTPGAWLLDRFLWLVTGYGVKLYRLGLLIALILLFGTIVFNLEGAVKPVEQILEMQMPLHLSYMEAFWVSLNTFLPIEISSGTNWIPSSNIIRVLGIRTGIKVTTVATLLELAGWIFVPIGIAGISGMLKRQNNTR
ncbi:hypothetical protein EO98_18460 [Methanosarcina sp. 2.H.T.1A.6]|uniref:pentapeptide repeat-containing protein n=1 Tax=unclassified Methanosarcina TaxID=2644672 RepID=UPI0006216866|nr:MULTISPECIES: pentapeptide repeat-containing protein [unclassified Methanosarcina]KKG17064.1 hypothetical protein EO94_18435 [Methanosarcina sp. 2.H.T.1A.3]KKG20313.1 hypothetical protein EO98_18460 [Methanosarcina sp. 2.H.T.1A.6]KKG21130.1 hypothetical protein EO97_00685 [Methanosarcina sp. 2.H.T.1A.15]KKG23423.1 hypothetical protein EO96_17400 [Methanosarcina sp. 2.H.T.1A.8]